MVFTDAVDVFLNEMQIYRSSLLTKHGQHGLRKAQNLAQAGADGETGQYKLAELNFHRRENAIVPTYLLALFGDINRLLDMIKAMMIHEDQFGFQGLTVPMQVAVSCTATSKDREIKAEAFAGASWEILAVRPYIRRVGLAFGVSVAMGDGNGIAWLRESFQDPSKPTTYTITASLRVSPSAEVLAILGDAVVSDLLKDFIFKSIIGNKCSNFGEMYQAIQQMFTPLAPDTSSAAESVEPATVKEKVLGVMQTVQNYVKGKKKAWQQYLKEHAKAGAKAEAEEIITLLFGKQIKDIWSHVPVFQNPLAPVKTSSTIGFDLVWGKEAGEPFAMQSIAWVSSTEVEYKVPLCAGCPQIKLNSDTASTETCDFTVEEPARTRLDELDAKRTAPEAPTRASD